MSTLAKAGSIDTREPTRVDPRPGRGALAIDGGHPVRRDRLPYGRHEITEADRAAVDAILRDQPLTGGPAVVAFERAVAEMAGTDHAIAVNSGTAALHASMLALGVGPGDEVIVPPITFVATANAAVMCGATPVFADVNDRTLLLDPSRVRVSLSERTKLVVTVDYTGRPSATDPVRMVCERADVPLLADACHAPGARLGGVPAPSLARAATFSFHPVKHAAAGEGGAIATNDPELAARATRLRSHGIDTDAAARERSGGHAYQMLELGHNYRLSDINAALAASQLSRLGASITRRRAIAHRYLDELADLEAITLPEPHEGHAWHLFVMRVRPERLRASRDEVFAALIAEGIGVNVHYSCVHLHPYYRERFETAEGQCPVAERAADELITLPLFPTMADSDTSDVIAAVRKVIGAYTVT
ncbi:MAG: aminotransferase class I/II-fold pyridoxal phosphate-dependent enzyme [Planctomycetota bacterium]